jgi:hypothetical protein
VAGDWTSSRLAKEKYKDGIISYQKPIENNSNKTTQ